MVRATLKVQKDPVRTGCCLKDIKLLTWRRNSGDRKELQISSAYFWDIMQYIMGVCNRRLSKTDRSHL